MNKKRNLHLKKWSVLLCLVSVFYLSQTVRHYGSYLENTRDFSKFTAALAVSLRHFLTLIAVSVAVALVGCLIQVRRKVNHRIASSMGFSTGCMVVIAVVMLGFKNIESLQQNSIFLLGFISVYAMILWKNRQNTIENPLVTQSEIQLETQLASQLETQLKKQSVAVSRDVWQLIAISLYVLFFAIALFVAGRHSAVFLWINAKIQGDALNLYTLSCVVTGCLFLLMPRRGDIALYNAKTDGLRASFKTLGNGLDAMIAVLITSVVMVAGPLLFLDTLAVHSSEKYDLDFLNFFKVSAVKSAVIVIFATTVSNFAAIFFLSPAMIIIIFGVFYCVKEKIR